MIVSLGKQGIGTTGAAAVTVLTGSTQGLVRVLEVGIFLTAATASDISLGRPAAVGITPTTPTDFLPEHPNDLMPTGTVQMATAWGTAPTAPTNPLRRIMLPANIGAGIIWTFPKGLAIAASGNLVIWNNATNSIANIYVVCDV